MHLPNSKICDKLVERYLQQNSYIVDILVGERIIANKLEILKTQRPKNMHGTTNADTKSITNIIEKITNSKM